MKRKTPEFWLNVITLGLRFIYKLITNLKKKGNEIDDDTTTGYVK